MWKYETPFETTAKGETDYTHGAICPFASLYSTYSKCINFDLDQILLGRSDVAGWGAFIKVR